MIINHFTAGAEITFHGVDIKKDLSDNDARVDEHDRTEQRLNLVATQEFHNSLTSSARRKKHQETPQRNSDILYLRYSWPALSLDALTRCIRGHFVDVTTQQECSHFVKAAARVVKL